MSTQSMKRKQAGCLGLLAASLTLATTASAGYIEAGGPADYSFFSPASAWDPGPGTARVGGFPSPGGATWSVMGGGIADSSHDDHLGDGAGNTVTTALTDLYVGGVDEVTTLGLVLDQWASVSGFTNLGQVADGGGAFGDSHSGDIRIGAIAINGPSGTLAHAWQPGATPLFTSDIGGDTHFDNSENWSDGGLNGTIDFYTVALHELGHALGLGHSDVVGSIMEATYAGPRRMLHADDIAGIQAIYGASAVPVPAAAWLFGSALISLVGAGRCRKTASTRSA